MTLLTQRNETPIQFDSAFRETGREQGMYRERKCHSKIVLARDTLLQCRRVYIKQCVYRIRTDIMERIVALGMVTPVY